MMDECSHCTCHGGRPHCTEGDCPTIPGMNECQNGDHWMNDCNYCECIEGNIACTKMLCTGLTTPQCQNGDHWMDDCNFCQCIDGNIACTKMLCIGLTTDPSTSPIMTVPTSPSPMMCYEATPMPWTAMDGCNTCFCYGGAVLCTTHPSDCWYTTTDFVLPPIQPRDLNDNTI